MRAFLAASFVACFALAGCAVTTDHGADPESTDSDEGALSVYGKQLVGAWEAKDGGAGFAHMVFAADGSYFADTVVYCIKAPCDPIRESGKFIGYKPAKGSDIGRLSLKHPTTTSYKIEIGDGAESFKLSLDGKTWRTFDRVTSYCDADADCGSQSYIHSMCAPGKAVCDTSSHACGWKCGTAACTYDEPGKSYVKKDPACVINFMCPADSKSFRDDCGCGCEKVAAPAKCVVTGCSGEICADSDMMSPCIWKDSFACYKSATCERGADGKCGWRATPELSACLAK